MLRQMTAIIEREGNAYVAPSWIDLLTIILPFLPGQITTIGPVLPE
jgi:hypothetical protein